MATTVSLEKIKNSSILESPFIYQRPPFKHGN